MLNEQIINLSKQFPGDYVHTDRWQGVDISKHPEMAMHELLFTTIASDMPTEDLDFYRNDVQPNLPWADEHFEERVCGEPLNPGETWKTWPYAHSANKFRDSNGQFNHNYMERYWPKWAGMTKNGTLDPRDNGVLGVNHGIRHPYGDLDNVVSLLDKDPTTRQAYFPVWFPEDTGDIHDGRKPCTLGYHLIMRDNQLHIVYYIRSCDFVRHLRDDIYLTIRLNLWVLKQLRMRSTLWNGIRPGQFRMHITSLHMFRNDFLTLKRSKL